MSTTQKFLLRPAPNTAVYPVDGTFNLLLAWDKANAGQAAKNSNDLKAGDYLNAFNEDWLPKYYAGRDIPYDADPPLPPVEQWACATAVFNDDSSLSFSFVLQDSPLKTPVCPIPPFQRLPRPQNGSVSLMGQLVAEGSGAGLPTIQTVPVGSDSKDSAGNSWVRTA